jgi:hypothetical protein
MLIRAYQTGDVNRDERNLLCVIALIRLQKLANQSSRFSYS